MATFTSAQAIWGLNAIGTPSSTNVSGTNTIGITQERIPLTGADVCYSLRAVIAQNGDLVVNLADGTTSGSTTWVAGTAQVETATSAGTITGSGNASVVVTAAGMTGSPKTISVAVTNGDTAAVWAGKVRTALAADSAVSALFTVGGSTTAISLTRKASDTVNGVDFYPANDSTLNISLDNGTCTGITTAATSANTTAGVATSGTYIWDGDGKDYEGVANGTINTEGVYGLAISLTATSTEVGVTSTSGNYDVGSVFGGQRIIRFTDVDSGGVAPDPDTITVSSGSGIADITITVIGKSA